MNPVRSRNFINSADSQYANRTSNGMKIGVFAGTFDPIHEGHLAFAAAAIKSHNLDQVVFLIEKRPRYKANVTAYQKRYAMLQLAIADQPKFDLVKAPDDQLTLTTTLPWLKKIYKNSELHFLMGQDVAATVKHWPDVALLRGATIILALRTNSGLNSYSSSQIRHSIVTGQPTAQLPKAVADYIRKNKLYAVASNE